MADDKKDAGAKGGNGDDAAAPKSGMVKMIAVVATVIVVGVGLALATYMFVLAPRLQPADAKTGEHGEAHGEHGEEDPHAGEDEKEMGEAAAIEFEDMSVNVLSEGPGAKPLLDFKCAIVVNNELLAEAIGEKTKKPLFSSILLKLHSNRTKTELNDPRVKESILRQAKQEANAMIKKLFPDNKEGKVLDVLHIKYTIFEI